MSGALIRGFVGMMTNDPQQFKKRVVPAILIPLAGVLAATALLLFSLTPALLEHFLEGADTPYAVIEAYYKWYEALSAVSIGGTVLVLICGGAGVLIGRKSAAAVLCAVCISVLGALACGAMGAGEDIPALKTQAREDMAQIENARLETEEVRFREEREASGLPGPYAEEQPTMFTVYRGIGEAAGWKDYYIPDSLGFAPDEAGYYDENKSLDWNDENARLYSLTYTANFRVVISIEPVNN